MKNPTNPKSLAAQFRGFLRTPPLWHQSDVRGIRQYEFDPMNSYGEPHLEIPATLVLGRRIEYLFEHYIQKSFREELLAANVQISSEKITIGELDFLLRNRFTGEPIHVELVYKFYIYDPDFHKEEDRWIGPNRRDTFVRKLDHLQKHQFPLLFRKETQPLLDSLGLDPQEIQQQVCFRGQLFIPPNISEKDLPLINTDCIQGTWIRKSEFTKKAFGSYLFHSPKKAYWITEPDEHKEWKTFSQIEPQLNDLLDRKKSPLVWMKKGSGEYQKFFLVWW